MASMRSTTNAAWLAVLVIASLFTAGLGIRVRRDKGHQHRATQELERRPFANQNAAGIAYIPAPIQTTRYSATLTTRSSAGIQQRQIRPSNQQLFHHPTRRPYVQRQRSAHPPTRHQTNAGLIQSSASVQQLRQHRPHAPIQHAPRPAYLPVPVSIPLTPHSLVIPAPPQQAYQAPASAYGGQQYQRPAAPQYQPAPAPQPQYAPPAAPAPYQPPAPQAYPAPAPAPYQPEPVAPQAYPAPAPYQPEPAAPQSAYSAPVAAPLPSLPPLPVPIYARRPQAAPAVEYAPAAQQQEAYSAPQAEYSTSAPVEAVEESVQESLIHDESANAGGYASADPVTVPPVVDVASTDVPVADQDIQTNTIAKSPTGTKSEASQWTQGSIPWTLEKLGQNTLNDLLVLSGLDDTFDKEGPFTVFVPIDQAFEILVQRFGGMEKATEEFNKNPDVLTSLLKHHVVPGTIPSSALQNNAVSQSLIGTPLRVKFYESEDAEWRPLKVITINGARIVRPDIQASNGLIHIVDRVIFPIPQADIYNTLKNDPQQRYTTLVSALERAGLVSVLANPTAGPYTVFAPTNKAFSLINRAELNTILNDPARLTKLLQRHVVQDLIYTSGLQGFQKAYALDFEILYIYHAKGMTKVNGANVVDQDLTALNGVIHSIDSVLGLN